MTGFLGKAGRMLGACTAMMTVLTVAAPANDGRHVMFILDASNSMWGQIGGRAKIEIAKEVLTRQFANLGEGTSAGLIAYGHRFDRQLNDCTDMELVGGYGRYSSDQVAGLLDYVTPKGQTPIAATLEESIGWVSIDTDNQPVSSPTVVLITDGAESCGGDPCAAAAKLAGAGISTKVHVVGFDLDDQQRALVGCIAESGNGRYFDARDAGELDEALRQVAQVEATPEPEPEPEAPAAPAAPTRESVFVDEFDGTALAPHWSVTNADEESYIVENGELLTVSSAIGGADVPDTRNVFTLTAPLPDGDWDAVVTFKAEFKTTRDRFQFGFWKDAENSLVGGLWAGLDRYNRCAAFFLRSNKRGSGEDAQFDTPLRNHGDAACDGVNLSKEAYPGAMEALATTATTLTMHKRGRAYHFSADLGEKRDDGTPIIYETSSFTSLRPPGGLSLMLGLWNKEGSGEVAAMIDRVEVFAVSP